MMTPQQDDLARAFVPRHLLAEMTSRCNLRCQYCQKTIAAWNAVPGRDDDMPAQVERRVFDALERLPFRMVQLSGIGEFTFRRDWVEVLERFVERRVALSLISNFAKRFTERELRALLKLHYLMVSIDTTDAALLRRVRKAVELSTIEDNLRRFRALADQLGTPLPYIKLNAALYVENALGILDLADFAVAHGVNEMQYERMYANGPFPTDLALIAPDRAAAALAMCRAVPDVLAVRGIACTFCSDLVQLFTARARNNG
jgi:MoaA/NifB/PqqE/SkfB family radical SAM enzyme